MTVFLPCRAGSERIPNKNTKTFAGVKGGLLVLKLKTLISIETIETIVISTNDKLVIDIANSLESKKISIDKRPEHLATSLTSTDDLINYVPTIIEDKDILWTHVTSPFISTETFEKAIELYLNNNDYDSLMSVNKIQTFLWDSKKPINYNRNQEKWPRTQTLPELYEVNSGFFINTRDNYLKHQDRIGKNPYLFVTEGYQSIDIDWPEDFHLAEMIFNSKKEH